MRLAKAGTLPSESLYIEDLSILHTLDNIKEIFKIYGLVAKVELKHVSNDLKLLTGYGFVMFESIDVASIAKETQNGQISFGRQMRLYSPNLLKVLQIIEYFILIRVCWASGDMKTTVLDPTVELLINFESTQVPFCLLIYHPLLTFSHLSDR